MSPRWSLGPWWQQQLAPREGAVHKLCRLKIDNFWPPPPLLVVFLLSKFGNFWPNPLPLWDDIVYGRPQRERGCISAFRLSRWLNIYFLSSASPVSIQITVHCFRHGLRTPRQEIAFTEERPKIHSHSQISRYGRSIFCLPDLPEFSDSLIYAFIGCP